MGPRFKVSYDRLVKPGIEPATPDLQGKRFIHYTIAAAHATKWLFIYRRDFSTCSMVVWGGGGGGGVHFFINCKYDFSFNAERMIVKTQELVPQKGC